MRLLSRVAQALLACDACLQELMPYMHKAGVLSTVTDSIKRATSMFYNRAGLL